MPGVLQQAQLDADHKGCLLVNTLQELFTDEVKINQRVRQLLHQLEQGFGEVLQQAPYNGELAQDKNSVRLTRLLISR